MAGTRRLPHLRQRKASGRRCRNSLPRLGATSAPVVAGSLPERPLRIHSISPAWVARTALLWIMASSASMVSPVGCRHSSTVMAG